MQQQQEEEAEAVAAADLREMLPVVAAMVVLAMPMVGVNAAATWTSHAWTTTGGAMP
jgi:hypothetical protein